MTIKKLQDLTLSGKRVLIRADLNVYGDSSKNAALDARLKELLPTLKLVTEQQGRAIVMSHMGKPKGRANPAHSLRTAAARLQELCGTTVTFAEESVGSGSLERSRTLQPGEILMLENLRFNPGEETNDQHFAAALAQLGDVFISEAFGTMHRQHASVVSVPKQIKERGIGLLVQRELDILERTLANPKRPLCFVLGGSKLSNRLKLVLNVAKKADKLVIGGAMANTFLAAQGLQMGRSLYEPELFPKVFELISTLARRDGKLYLPVDFRIGDSLQSHGLSRIVTAQEVPAESMVLDIGPATSSLYGTAIANADTIVWNGPMGAFENEDYASGTHEIVQALGSAHGLTIAGGGDTEAAIRQMELSHKFGFISSGGGAFLATLEGEKLPGLAVLEC